MAHTFAYLSSNGQRITAGDNDLVVNVYQMNANYTYDAILEDQAVSAGESYDISYSEDGVYKILVIEEEVEYSYSDVNSCTFKGYYQTYIKNILCCDDNCATDEALRDGLHLGILSFGFLCNNTYTPASETDFEDSVVIGDLQRIYDALARVNKYINNISDEEPCCTT